MQDLLGVNMLQGQHHLGKELEDSLQQKTKKKEFINTVHNFSSP
jgi:hypothetical protein